MSDASELTHMREFIGLKGLNDEFERYRNEQAAKQESLTEPAVSVAYCTRFKRSHHDDEINITPWLRGAGIDDVLRLVRLARDDAPTHDEDDREFLEGIVSECADEETFEWMCRAMDTDVELYGFIGKFAEHVREIRPEDHGRILPELERHGPDVSGSGEIDIREIISVPL